MPTLKTPFWDQNGRLYRPGAEIPSEALRPSSAKASAPETEGEAATYPYADVLSEGGFADWDAVKSASDEDILAVNGIGPTRLKEIRAYKG